MILVCAFALLALVLGAVGIYGIVSYSVTQRTQEIGIRMALGARTANMLSLILKNGLMLVLAGIAIGYRGGACIDTIFDDVAVWRDAD